MAESQNIVKIQFKPEGDKNLVRAIQALDIHTKSLVGTQAGLQQSQRDSRNEMTKMLKSLRSTGMDFKKLGISVDVLNKAYQGHTTSIDRTRIAYERYNKFLKSVGVSTQKNTIINKKASRGLFELGHSARQTGGAFSVLRSKLLLFNFAMGLGIRQVMRFAEEASQLEALETAFNTLSGGGENASISLDKLKNATDGTVNSMDLFQQANNAMILGVTKNSDEMAQMFDMAQRLGRALGRDTRSSIESFVTGVGRQSRLMLDNIGLIVKAEVAYKAFAKQVGKNADELDEMERKQAFLNAALFAGEQALRGIGTETLSSADKLQQMSTQLAEVRQEIGEQLLPLVLEAAKVVKEFAEEIDGDDIRNAIATIETLTVAFVSFKAIVATTQGFVALLSLSFPQVALIASVASAIGALGVEYQKASKRALDLKSKQQELISSFNSAKKTIEDYADFLENFEKNRKNAINQIQAEADARIESDKKATESFIDYLSVLKLGHQEINELRKLESSRSRLRKELEDEFKNLTLSNKNEIINSLVEIQMQKERAFLEDKQRSKREENLGKVKEAYLKFLNNKIEKDEQSHHDRLTAMKKKASEIEDKLLREQIMLKIEALNIEADAEIAKIDEMDAFFQRREELKRTALGDTTAFRLKKLGEMADEFNRLGLNEPKFVKFLEDEKTRIVEEGVQARLDQKKKEVDAERKAMNDTIALHQGYLSAYNGFVSSLDGLFQSRMENDIASLKATDSYQRASAEERQNMEEDVMRKHSRAQASLFMLNKVAKLAEIAINTATAVTSAMAMPGGLALVPFIKAMGLAQAAIVSATPPPPTFETGGLVGGRRHSQGGTIIEAEQGEFVMSRNAVQAIGVETLNQMNQGGGSGVTINIQGNMVGNESFVRDILIPEISKATNQGLA